MKKNKKSSTKKARSLIIICNLTLSIIAIAFMIGLQSEMVSGDETIAPVATSAPKVPIAGETYMYVQLDGKDQVVKWTGTENNLAKGITANGEVKTWSAVADKDIKYATPNEITKAGFKDAAAGKGWIKSLLTPKAGAMGLLQGLGYAGTAYWAVGKIGNMLGLSPEMTKALQKGSAAGVGTYYGLSAFFGKNAVAGSFATKGIGGFIGSHIGMISLGVGLIVLLLTYKKVTYKTVNFQCLSWEAPIGGNDCEKCNNGLQVCSEYRCKSLGQACQLVNAGTGKELCYWANPKDVTSPMITPWADVLTAGYKYANTQSRPPSWGTEITRDKGASNCIAAFTPIEFGITTNKPSQCKIDFNRSYGFDNMQYYFGEDNLYGYNHSQIMNLPSPNAINNFAASTIGSNASSSVVGGGSSGDQLTIQNDGNYELYIRCRSGNGYWNADPYVIKFCVDKGPDVTPPAIMETSIINNQPVQFGVDKVPITVYTNEPATCRWSRTDQTFDKMENSMTCAASIAEMQSNLFYACSGTLTNVEDRKDNTYFFKCEDQPWIAKTDRNVMAQSYRLTLKGTQPLNINKDSIKPFNETITGATTTVNATLELKTENGYNNGEAECDYSINNQDNYVPFFSTNSYIHQQRQDLTAGTYTYYFKCLDLGGNQDTASTTFTVKIDTTPPQVVRILYDAQKLKIITDKDAECVYSNNPTTACNYDINGNNVKSMAHETQDIKTAHYAAWNPKETYYIKCKDKNNIQPDPTQCSIAVKPVELTQSASG